MEVIGGVKIDESKYSGQDLYSDGRVEDTILDLVSERPGVKFNDLPGEYRNWPTLYHLSPLRENIVSWVPLTAMDKVLEVGSGCGAITGVLSEKAGSVTCVELSRKRSLINACRHNDRNNITIHLGNFQDIEPELDGDYDYIFLIGVLEYAGSYLNAPNPYIALISSLKKHLSSMGRLIIAIENRLGLKYFAGYREDHVGEYFSGIENYPNKNTAVTFSRRMLDQICRQAGFQNLSFYYPYPDYKFMTTLYSDERLPKTGELTDNMRNFDHDRLYLFDEKSAFDGIVMDGLFPIFSNSFLVVAGPSIPVVYARYSNDRARRFAIRTEIRHPSSGVNGSAIAALAREKGSSMGEEYDKSKLEVRKIPLCKEAEPHVAAMEQTWKRLMMSYPGNGLLITPVTIDGNQAVFPYLQGRTLEEVFDRCLETGNEATFRQFFDYYYRLVSAMANKEIANFDFIFSNIIITADSRWHLIDYEWMPPKRATMDELAARALFCYGLGSRQRNEMARKLLAEKFGCSDEEIRKLAAREERFQRFTTGGEGSMVDVRNMLDMPIVPVMEQVRKYLDRVAYNRIQIYEDYGDGFSEEKSYFLKESYPENQKVTVDIDLRRGIRAIRLDPALDYCLLYISGITVGRVGYTLDELERRLDTNGILMGNGLILFSSTDPFFTISNIDELIRKDRRDDEDDEELMDETAYAGKETSGQDYGGKGSHRGADPSHPMLPAVVNSFNPEDGDIISMLTIEMEMVRISKNMGIAAQGVGELESEDQSVLVTRIKNFIGNRFKR